MSPANQEKLDAALRSFRARGGGKYGNESTNVETENGVKSFHSKLEADRFHELRIMEKAGEIRDLDTQTVFRLAVNGVHITKYLADFTYYTKNGRYVVEDTKSPASRTPAYMMKKRLMKAVHGIEIQELVRRQVGRFC